MSLDVTFHPIREDELKRFVAEPILDPTTVGARATEAAETPEKQEALMAIYETLTAVGQAALAGLGLGPDDGFKRMDVGPLIFIAAAVSLGAAAIAGYLHPYWYARGAGVAHLVEEDEEVFGDLIAPLGAILGEAFMTAPDPDLGGLSESFMGGGFISLDNLDALEDALDGEGAETAEAVLGEDGLEALLQAIGYASRHGCGLLEASDVVSPAEETFFSDRQNLRAPYLENAEDYANARSGLKRH